MTAVRWREPIAPCFPYVQDTGACWARSLPADFLRLGGAGMHMGVAAAGFLEDAHRSGLELGVVDARPEQHRPRLERRREFGAVLVGRVADEQLLDCGAAATGPPESITMPATVSGPRKFTSSVSPESSMPPGVPR